MDIKENTDFQIVAQHYPHVAKTLEMFWGRPEFDEVMDRFLKDTREGQRKGFPSPTGAALLALAVLHHNLYPPPPVNNVWTDNHPGM